MCTAKEERECEKEKNSLFDMAVCMRNVDCLHIGHSTTIRYLRAEFSLPRILFFPVCKIVCFCLSASLSHVVVDAIFVLSVPFLYW